SGRSAESHQGVKGPSGNTDLILRLLLDQRIDLGLVEGPCRRREIQDVSRLSVQQELASGQLVEIHCAKLPMKRAFSVLIPQGPDPIGIVQAFSKFITRS